MTSAGSPDYTGAESNSIWHTPERIAPFLQQRNVYLKPAEICGKHGIRQRILFSWKAKYGFLSRSEGREIDAGREKKRGLKRLLDGSELDKATQEIILGNVRFAPRLR